MFLLRFCNKPYPNGWQTLPKSFNAVYVQGCIQKPKTLVKLEDACVITFKCYWLCSRVHDSQF